MLLPWSKPPAEITCPICGARLQVPRDKNNQFLLKPHCDSCGWNVARARRQLLRQIGQNVAFAAIFALYAWAITDTKWSTPFVGGWVLMAMGYPIFSQLRRLPRDRPAPRLEALSGIADFRAVTLETTRPRLNLLVEGAIVVGSAAAILFLPRELNPARRAFPKVPHELLFVILTTLFAAYQLTIHAVLFVRLIRSIRLENHLAKRAMMVKGRVTESNSGLIRYEFLDYSSQLIKGSGRDYTLGLYEDMPLPVLYDPDDSSLTCRWLGCSFIAHVVEPKNSH
ncbi:MAG: hypothetical protein JO065_16495 [Acidobacteria bacterium]|nr:hypothetical protein [Acidobacteriota bacterium]